MSSDGSNPSQYVKLKKEYITDQPDTEPGELSQPVEVPQLEVQRCIECGQVLPQSYEPPQDEPWTTGIFACFKDQRSCIQGALCPCVLFGKNVEALRDDIPWSAACACHVMCIEGGVALGSVLLCCPAYITVDPQTLFLLGETLFFAWWMCGIYTGLFRQELQKKYHLKNAPCDPCCVHCCLHPCALCQEHREMVLRLPALDEGVSLNPPPQQEMAAVGGAAAGTGAAANGGGEIARES
ncbi:hypothetical protein CLOM_g12571 [Closterium sp. NIES-68]|nr:hypothetical protein CLOM_g12571 [Closterium sp. NIES-68]GJP85037.1 hypothetical protein CLOP_g15072 [Closterium sp. NIES-67]